MSKLKKILIAVNKYFILILNFILTIPLYFIGIGLSRIFYRKKKNNAATNWCEPEAYAEKENMF